MVQDVEVPNEPAMPLCLGHANLTGWATINVRLNQGCRMTTYVGQLMVFKYALGLYIFIWRKGKIYVRLISNLFCVYYIQNSCFLGGRSSSLCVLNS